MSIFLSVFKSYEDGGSDKISPFENFFLQKIGGKIGGLPFDEAADLASVSARSWGVSLCGWLPSGIPLLNVREFERFAGAKTGLAQHFWWVVFW